MSDSSFDYDVIPSFRSTRGTPPPAADQPSASLSATTAATILKVLRPIESRLDDLEKGMPNHGHDDVKSRINDLYYHWSMVGQRMDQLSQTMDTMTMDRNRDRARATPTFFGGERPSWTAPSWNPPGLHSAERIAAIAATNAKAAATTAPTVSRPFGILETYDSSSDNQSIMSQCSCASSHHGVHDEKEEEEEEGDDSSQKQQQKQKQPASATQHVEHTSPAVAHSPPDCECWKTYASNFHAAATPGSYPHPTSTPTSTSPTWLGAPWTPTRCSEGVSI
ncbi:hypothetical protein B0T26DRAFT_675371 [Lasiosphaeria miniovina]|uniref:Uncharacterized protein n=1 Tax=Lasiosphaeria miniovina TaxID=1954250 RepID=A0AA40AJL6_9PEZI|nr:uncharacterized protein B0T26DRAFT_675371 [Lasiosphaeria miniovina]KAK0716980.1 hypothetical protein B0T26DRAFT_675371 [Lasiosphaeria miniovina]